MIYILILALIYTGYLMYYYSPKNRDVRDEKFVRQCKQSYNVFNVRDTYPYSLDDVRKDFDSVGNYDIDIRVYDKKGNYLYSHPKTKK